MSFLSYFTAICQLEFLKHQEENRQLDAIPNRLPSMMAALEHSYDELEVQNEIIRMNEDTNSYDVDRMCKSLTAYINIMSDAPISDAEAIKMKALAAKLIETKQGVHSFCTMIRTASCPNEKALSTIQSYLSVHAELRNRLDAEDAFVAEYLKNPGGYLNFEIWDKDNARSLIEYVLTDNRRIVELWHIARVEALSCLTDTEFMDMYRNTHFMESITDRSAMEDIKERREAVSIKLTKF